MYVLKAQDNHNVLSQVAQYKVYSQIAYSIVPTLLSFYIGAWCDIFGRKFIMYTYLLMRIVSQGNLLLNAYFMSWPKELLLISDALPSIIGKIFLS